jgi:hypothetical protein
MCEERLDHEVVILCRLYPGERCLISSHSNINTWTICITFAIFFLNWVFPGFLQRGAGKLRWERGGAQRHTLLSVNEPKNTGVHYTRVHSPAKSTS